MNDPLAEELEYEYGDNYDAMEDKEKNELGEIVGTGRNHRSRSPLSPESHPWARR